MLSKYHDYWMFCWVLITDDLKHDINQRYIINQKLLKT